MPVSSAAGARLAVIAVAAGTVLAAVPSVFFGPGAYGTTEHSTFTMLLALASAVPFAVFAFIQRRWSRAAAWATFGGLLLVSMATLGAVATDGSSTAGLAFVFLPAYLFGFLALAKAARDLRGDYVRRRRSA